MILVDTDIITLGKYKNTALKDIPAEFLLAIKDKGSFGKLGKVKIEALLQYITANEGVLRHEIQQSIQQQEEQINEDTDIDFNMFEEC